jgi:hypothetical protein
MLEVKKFFLESSSTFLIKSGLFISSFNFKLIENLQEKCNASFNNQWQQV